MEWREYRPEPDQHEREEPQPASRRKLPVLIAVLVVALCAVGAIGWFASRLLARPDASGEGSLQALASNVIDRTWDIGTVFAESAQRDMARLRDLLDRSDEEEDEETELSAEDLFARANPVVDPLPMVRRRTRRPPRVFAPVPHVAVDAPVMESELTLPPLLGVFDGADPGVVPPETVIRHRDLASDEVWNESALVEIIVAPDGTVERSKLISIPHDIHESMVLSAIKSWRFEPATKDGHPVRYRLLMPVDAAR